MTNQKFEIKKIQIDRISDIKTVVKNEFGRAFNVGKARQDGTLIITHRNPPALADNLQKSIKLAYFLKVRCGMTLVKNTKAKPNIAAIVGIG